MGPEFLESLEARTALETPQVVLSWVYGSPVSSLYDIPWDWVSLTLQRSDSRFPEDETEGTTVLSESFSTDPTAAVGDTSVSGLLEYYYSLFFEYTEHSTVAINQDIDVSRVGAQFGAVLLDEREVLVTGTDGASNGTAVFTSAGSTFLEDEIEAGFFLEIDEGGADDGFYVIQSVDSETQVTLTSSLTLTASNVDFNIYTSHEKYWIAGVSYYRKATLWRYDTHTGMVDKSVDLSEILDLDEFVSAMAFAGTISGTKYLSFLTPKRYVRIPQSDDLVYTVEEDDLTVTWLLSNMPANYVVKGAFLDLSVFAGADTVYVLDGTNQVIQLLTEATGAAGASVDLSGLDDSDSEDLQGLAPDYTNSNLLVGNRNYVYVLDEGVSSPDPSHVSAILVLRENFLADIGLYEDEFTGNQYVAVVHHEVDRLRTYSIEAKTKSYLWQQPYVADADCVALYHLEDESGAIVDASANGHDGTNNGMTYSATGRFNDGMEADAVTEYVDISAVSSSFNGAEGTVELWFAASAAPVLNSGDSTLCTLEVDANNKVTISIVSGQLSFSYVAGGTTSSVVADHPSADTEFHHYTISWSATADEVKAFVDDTQFGTTQTSLGTWAGTIATGTIGHDTQAALGIYDDIRISDVARDRYSSVQSYTDANKMYAFSGRDYDATYEDTDPQGFHYRDEFFTEKFMGGGFIIRNDYEREKLYPQNDVIEDNEVIFRGPDPLPELGHTGRLSRLLGLYLDRLADAREGMIKIYDRYVTDFDSIPAIANVLGLQGLDVSNWNVDKQRRFLRVMPAILKAGGRDVSYQSYARLLGFLLVGDHLQTKLRFDSVHYNANYDTRIQAIPFDTMGSFDTSDERFPIAILRWRIYYPSTKSTSGVTSAAASRLLSDTAATFTSTTEVGSLIKINDPDATGDNGKYIVTEVHSNTELKVDKDWPAGSLTGLTYTNNWEVPYPDPWTDFVVNRFREHLAPDAMSVIHRDQSISSIF